MTTSSESVHFTAPAPLCGTFSIACGGAGLPVHLSPFIGREAELRELSPRLESSRLLTLCGAGGSGKTRLACALAASAVPLVERVVWVSLAALADGALVSREAAAAYGGLQRDDSAAASLATAIGEARVLLVLDGCEHVVDACAELVEGLLRACPALRVLATSREALGIPIERPWLVPPLARPEAVALFLDRARAALPSFAPSGAGMVAIHEICRRLDGIPLAIELAAARVRVLSPEQIADRLGDALRLLTGGTRTALPRQRTLRGTLDWSYHLLCRREQVLLARLAVFAGSFSLEAAEDVCAGAPLEAEDILDGVAALVDRSLVEMEPGEDRARYRLLEIVRQYAAERLLEAGEVEQVRARHGAFFVRLAGELAPRLLIGDGDARLLARLESEHENLRAAGEWAASDPARATAGLILTDALFWHAYAKGSWFESGQFRESRRSIAAAVASAGDVEPLPRGRMLAALGLSAFAQGDYDDARSALEESVAIMREHGDAAMRAFVLSKLGAVHIMRGDPGAARRLLDESLEMTRQVPSMALRAYVCLWRGWAAHVAGDGATARAMLEEAIQLGHRSAHHATFAHASALLGRVEYAQGNFGRAFARLHEALRADLEANDGWGIVLDLEGMIGLAVARGAYANACRLMGGVDALCERLAIAPLATDRPERQRLADLLREQLGRDVERHREEGRSLALEELVRIATDGAGEHTEEYRVPLHAGPALAPALTPPPSCGAAAAPSLRVLALGPLQVFVGDRPIEATAWGSARTRELLVFLLMHPEGCTKEQVGLVFWPEASAAQLRNSFHVTLHRLRRALRNPEWIALVGDRYRVHPDVVAEFDVVEFERDVSAARRALRRREEGAVAALERALSRFHGDLLDGEPVGDWHLEHRDRMQRLYVDALVELGGRLAEDERWEQAVDAYRRVLARDDLHEEAMRALMRCHARLGERAQALRLYQRFADRLREELDAEPDEETRQVYARVQQGRG